MVKVFMILSELNSKGYIKSLFYSKMVNIGVFLLKALQMSFIDWYVVAIYHSR